MTNEQLQTALLHIFLQIPLRHTGEQSSFRAQRGLQLFTQFSGRTGFAASNTNRVVFFYFYIVLMGIKLYLNLFFT